MVRLRGLPSKQVLLSCPCGLRRGTMPRSDSLSVSWPVAVPQTGGRAVAFAPSRGGSLQFPRWTVPAFRVPYAGGFLTAPGTTATNVANTRPRAWKNSGVLGARFMARTTPRASCLFDIRLCNGAPQT